MSRRFWRWVYCKVSRHLPDLRVCNECRAVVMREELVRHAKYHDRLIECERLLGVRDDD